MPTRSPEQWLALLEERLNNRLPRIDLYERYRAGDHRLLFATSKFREAFGDIFGPFATNWCALVVDAAVERMAINGFRFGDAEEADEDAWSIWQDNGLDAGSLQAHTTAVNSETAYLLVAPP
ncbi:MAG TPA: hypothetical protein VK631_22140, partial [Solirubrobacteraceae bacterium]|nr:hypothetical protein [Solirubrobacteraceae bacterium]